MPALGKQIAAFFDKEIVDIDETNVAHYFLWADKYGAMACQHKCQDYMKKILTQRHDEHAYYNDVSSGRTSRPQQHLAAFSCYAVRSRHTMRH